MAEGIATKRAQEPLVTSGMGNLGIVDHADEIFGAIARRAFELFERNGHSSGRDLDNWLEAEREFLHPVHLSVADADDALELSVEVPGFSEKELEIKLDRRTVSIAGKRESTGKKENGNVIYSDRCCANLLRTIELPMDVEADKATATLRNGILTLLLPKAAGQRAIRIHPKT